MTKKTAAPRAVRAAAIGYGGAFNMGPTHLRSMLKNPGFTAAAVCDPDAKRLQQAEIDFPGIAAFKSLDQMLAANCADLAIIITPHNTHAAIALKCLAAGMDVVCEKPLAITEAEVQAMLKAAKAKKRMLTTFHNRRWDGDFMTLRRLVREGWIGPVFRVEAGFSGYHGQNPNWWRSDAKISGGNIYDWGAHFTDWILSIVDDKIDHVTGMERKNPAWAKQYTNADHSECAIRFAKGCVSTLTMSNLSMEGKPRWRVLGEEGSITDAGQNNAFLVKSLVRGRVCQTVVPFEASDHDAFYTNIARHLQRGEPLVITPESAARVIGVLHASVRSAAQGGKPVKPILP